MELIAVEIENPKGYNLVIGSSHFIMTPEDIAEALLKSVPSIKYGVSFCEASPPALIRTESNDEELAELSRINAMSIGAGHSFIIFVKDCFPINFINSIKNLPEVTCVYCATANPVKVLAVSLGDQKSIIGVADGISPKGFEGDEDRIKRFQFLRDIGYKLDF
ncbi:adenosine-specific kinase [candidate division WOR-3 bacterium]|nr:adenosine-specific kinase [candidate division WOR-3 bacterium]